MRRPPSPSEDGARYATKRSVSWVGDAVQLTETCDDDLPRLVAAAGPTVAPAADVDHLGPLHARLVPRDLLPSAHVVDTGCVRTGNPVTSQQAHQLDRTSSTASARWPTTASGKRKPPPAPPRRGARSTGRPAS